PEHHGDRERDHDPHRPFGEVKQLDEADRHAGEDHDGAGEDETGLRTTASQRLSRAPLRPTRTRHRSTRSPRAWGDASRPTASAMTAATSDSKSRSTSTTRTLAPDAHGRHATFAAVKSTSAGAPTAAAR